MTIEDIRKGIAENPELKTGLLTDLESEIPEYLKGKSYIVRTVDEQTEWEKQFETNKINPRVKEIYGGLEKDVLDTFGPLGLKKESNTERVFDMVKKVPALYQAKIDALQKSLDEALAGKGDDVTAKQLAALKAELDSAKAEKEQLSSSFTQRELSWKADNDQEKAFAELQIAVPAHIAEKDKGDYIANKRAQLLTTLNSMYKVEERDGKLVYTKDGDVQMKGAEIATAKDLLEQVGKYDFTTVKKGGSGDDGKGGNGSGDAGLAGVTDKDSAYAYAAKQGYVMGSEKFNEFIKKAKEKGIKFD